MKDRLYFLKELGQIFPEALARINEYETGLLHCEIGPFREFVESSMESERHWECEKAFQFIEASLTGVSPELENSILISFIEDLALGPHT